MCLCGATPEDHTEVTTRPEHSGVLSAFQKAAESWFFPQALELASGSSDHFVC